MHDVSRNDLVNYFIFAAVEIDVGMQGDGRSPPWQKYEYAVCFSWQLDYLYIS